MGKASPLWPHLTLNYFPKDCSPDTVTLGISTLTYEFWGSTTQSLTDP